MFRNSFLAALILLCLPVMAMAENRGIDFGTMPVGCTWTIRYSNGNVWVETFKGKDGGSYVTEKRDGSAKGPLVSRIRFNKNGWMTERVWAKNKWERFSPYSCFGEPRECRFVFTNADGVRSVILNTTTGSAETYKVKGRIEGGHSFPTETITLGPFNMGVSSKSSNYWSKTTDFTNCGLASS